VTQPATSIGDAWALVRRNGDTPNKRLSTRMAYLVETAVGPDGKAVAYRGYVMRNDTTGWSKSLRRIEFGDVLKQWRYNRQPTSAQVHAAKNRLPVAQTAPHLRRAA
jgi:hypothetical protein